MRVALLHGPTGVLDPVLHLHDACLERLGGLRGREAVDLAQQQGRRLLRRQVPRQRAGKADGEALARNRRELRRAAQLLRFGEEYGIRDRATAGVDEDQLLPGTVPPQVVDREIADDAEQPGADPTLVVGQSLLLEQAKRGLLGQLFGDALLHDHAGRIVHQLATMPLVDVGASVALPHVSTSLPLS